MSQSVCVLRENRSRSSSLVKRLAPCKGTEVQNHHSIRTLSHVLHWENRSLQLLTREAADPLHEMKISK